MFIPLERRCSSFSGVARGARTRARDRNLAVRDFDKPSRLVARQCIKPRFNAAASLFPLHLSSCCPNDSFYKRNKRQAPFERARFAPRRRHDRRGFAREISRIAGNTLLLLLLLINATFYFCIRVFMLAEVAL